MGTDIHLYIERYGYFHNPQTDEETQAWQLVATEDFTYHERNYEVFSLLAGVRNGTWGEEVKPIAEPRGLPTDASAEVKAAYPGEHTPSWLTLREIFDFNWHQKIQHEAHVAPAEALYMLLNDRSAPRTYSAAVSGKKEVSYAEFAKLAKAVKLTAAQKLSLKALAPWGGSLQDPGLKTALGSLLDYTVIMKWETEYEDACGDFLDWCRSLSWPDEKTKAAYREEKKRVHMKPMLETRLLYTEPEGIRLVFWFDS